MQPRFATIALGVCLISTLPVYGQQQRSELDRIAPGDTITLPAELGTTQEILGLGFDQALNSRDAAGQVHRVYPSTAQLGDESRFEVNVDVIENQTELGAQARLLFLKAGARTVESKRYVVLRVARIKRVASLQEGGSPQDTAAFVAQRVLYGWAIYHILEGDATTFTENIAASFKHIGIGFDKVVKKYGLHVRKIYLGLTPTVEDSPETVLDDRTSIEQSFHVNPEPVPIAVEYRALQDIYTKRISWATNKLHPGPYFLGRIKVKIADGKADGRPWDNLSPPDPLVQVYLDDKLVHTCMHDDAFEAVCDAKKLIMLKSDSAIRVKVLDRDGWEDDDLVGNGGLEGLLKRGVAFEDMELQTTDQLERATIQLIPMPKSAEDSEPSPKEPETAVSTAPAAPEQPASLQMAPVPPILNERPKETLFPGGPTYPPAAGSMAPQNALPQIILRSGLRYVELRPGNGAYPRMGQYVWIYYAARLADGRTYDSTIGRNQPLGFWLGSPQVLRGLQEGVSSMRVGGRRRLIIPPYLGYGATPAGIRVGNSGFQTIDVDLVGISN